MVRIYAVFGAERNDIVHTLIAKKGLPSLFSLQPRSLAKEERNRKLCQVMAGIQEQVEQCELCFSNPPFQSDKIVNPRSLLEVKIQSVPSRMILQANMFARVTP